MPLAPISSAKHIRSALLELTRTIGVALVPRMAWMAGPKSLTSTGECTLCYSQYQDVRIRINGNHVGSPPNFLARRSYILKC